jgi:hypothetical protein
LTMLPHHNHQWFEWGSSSVQSSTKHAPLTGTALQELWRCRQRENTVEIVAQLSSDIACMVFDVVVASEVTRTSTTRKARLLVGNSLQSGPQES